MSLWSDSTYAALGLEVQRAQTAAVDTFMASHGGGNRVLTAVEVADLLRITWEAISMALLKHVGPVSSDSSVTFGVVNTGDTIPVPQLDIRATGGGDHLVFGDTGDSAAGTLNDKLLVSGSISKSVVTSPLGVMRVQISAPPDDHLLLASTLDTSPGNLARKAYPGTNVTITPEVDPAGGERLRFATPAFYAGTMMPDGGEGYHGAFMPGGDLVARGPHIHPLVPPEVVGSTFYPVMIANPLRMPTVKAILVSGAGHVFGFSSGMYTAAPGSPYTWIRGDAGPLYGQTAGVDPIPLYDGDVFAICTDAIEYPTPGPENPYYGLYRVIDCGLHIVGGIPTLTRPTFTRIDEMNQASEFVVGSFFQIVGSGAEYEGQYFAFATTGAITLDTTPLEFEITADPSAPPTYELLTGPQLATRGASEETQTVSTTIMNEAMAIQPVTPTILGTPGLSEIPSGPFKVTARLRVSFASDTYVTQFFYRLFPRYADNTLGPAFMDIVSPPLNNTTDVDYTFTGFLSAAVPWSPTWRLEGLPVFQTNSPSPITCYFTYQDPTRATRIVMPFVSAAGSTTVPAGAITPGRYHTSFGTATIDANGDLQLPDRNDVLVTVGASGTLRSIGTGGWQAGDKVWLTFLQPLRLIGWATSPAPPTGNAPLFLLTMAGIPDSEISTSGRTDTGNLRVCVQLRTDAGISPSPCWQIIAGPFPGVVYP